MNTPLDFNVMLTAGTAIFATIVGGIVALVTSRRAHRASALEKKNVSLSHDLLRASEQVAAYHVLENEYAGDLAAARRVSPRTVKTEYRNRVEALGYSRPKWTAEDARETFESAAESLGN